MPFTVKEVKLCRNHRCCPVMKFGEDKVVLSDDYNGSVQLTHEEMESLIEEYQALKPELGK